MYTFIWTFSGLIWKNLNDPVLPKVITTIREARVSSTVTDPDTGEVLAHSTRYGTINLDSPDPDSFTDIATIKQSHDNVKALIDPDLIQEWEDWIAADLDAKLNPPEDEGVEEVEVAE